MPADYLHQENRKIAKPKSVAVMAADFFCGAISSGPAEMPPLRTPGGGPVFRGRLSMFTGHIMPALSIMTSLLEGSFFECCTRIFDFIMVP